MYLTDENHQFTKLNIYSNHIQIDILYFKYFILKLTLAYSSALSKGEKGKMKRK